MEIVDSQGCPQGSVKTILMTRGRGSKVDFVRMDNMKTYQTKIQEAVYGTRPELLGHKWVCDNGGANLYLTDPV